MDRNLKQKPTIGRRLQEVQEAYRTLWQEFLDAAATQQLRAKAANEAYGAQLKIEDAVPKAEALLVLPSWRYKASSDKRIDIVVQVVEWMDEQIASVKKCTTQIGYFERDEQEQHRSLLEMHYDFEMPVSEAHPVFHAQIGQTKWPLDRLSDLGLTLQRASESESAAGLYGSARIPTAFIGFPQILTILAADYLRPRAYRKVIAEVRAAHGKLPVAHCGEFGREIQVGKFPVAHHWYEHRYEASLEQISRKGAWKAAVPLLQVEATGPTKAAAENALIGRLNIPRDQIRFTSVSAE